jgi:hypothetical protein
MADQLANARSRAAALARMLGLYRPLASSVVKDFFTANLWETVPRSWRAGLDGLGLEDLASILLSPAPPAPPAVGGVWPLSFLAFLAAAHGLRLPGQLDSRGGRVSEQGRCSEESQLNSVLRTAVRPKKMHEIVRLAALVDQTGRAAGSNLAVDIGSGLGYLSRTLAFEHNWSVLGVECSADNAAEAARLDSRVEKMLRCRLSDGHRCAWQPARGSVRHVVARIEPHAPPAQLWAALEEAGPAPPPPRGDAALPRASVLVGLHPCGDLGPTLLRTYHHSSRDEVAALVLVGCCYHKLTEREPAPTGSERGGCRAADAGAGARLECSPCGPCAAECGYPLSAHVRDLRISLGPLLREAACHSLSAYAARLRECARLGDAAPSTLVSHARRAAVERLIISRAGASAPATSLGAIRGAEKMDFDAYLAACYARLGLPACDAEECARLAAEAGPLLSQWRRVVVFNVLRLLLAPLSEALLLLDRLLYLREGGHHAALVPLFDPALSPRSYALVAVKGEGALPLPEERECM